nr:mucin-17-like [Procambarus clarkii]
MAAALGSSCVVIVCSILVHAHAQHHAHDHTHAQDHAHTQYHAHDHDVQDSTQQRQYLDETDLQRKRRDIENEQESEKMDTKHLEARLKNTLKGTNNSELSFISQLFSGGKKDHHSRKMTGNKIKENANSSILKSKLLDTNHINVGHKFRNDEVSTTVIPKDPMEVTRNRTEKSTEMSFSAELKEITVDDDDGGKSSPLVSLDSNLVRGRTPGPVLPNTEASGYSRVGIITWATIHDQPTTPLSLSQYQGDLRPRPYAAYPHLLAADVDVFGNLLKVAESTTEDVTMNSLTARPITTSSLPPSTSTKASGLNDDIKITNNLVSTAFDKSSGAGSYVATPAVTPGLIQGVIQSALQQFFSHHYLTQQMADLKSTLPVLVTTTTPSTATLPTTDTMDTVDTTARVTEQLPPTTADVSAETQQWKTPASRQPGLSELSLLDLPTRAPVKQLEISRATYAASSPAAATSVSGAVTTAIPPWDDPKEALYTRTPTRRPGPQPSPLSPLFNSPVKYKVPDTVTVSRNLTYASSRPDNSSSSIRTDKPSVSNWQSPWGVSKHAGPASSTSSFLGSYGRPSSMTNSPSSRPQPEVRNTPTPATTNLSWAKIDSNLYVISTTRRPLSQLTTTATSTAGNDSFSTQIDQQFSFYGQSKTTKPDLSLENSSATLNGPMVTSSMNLTRFNPLYFESTTPRPFVRPISTSSNQQQQRHPQRPTNYSSTLTAFTSVVDTPRSPGETITTQEVTPWDPLYFQPETRRPFTRPNITRTRQPWPPLSDVEDPPGTAVSSLLTKPEALRTPSSGSTENTNIPTNLRLTLAAAATNINNIGSEVPDMVHEAVVTIPPPRTPPFYANPYSLPEENHWTQGEVIFIAPEPPERLPSSLIKISEVATTDVNSTFLPTKHINTELPLFYETTTAQEESLGTPTIHRISVLSPRPATTPETPPTTTWSFTNPWSSHGWYDSLPTTPDTDDATTTPKSTGTRWDLPTAPNTSMTSPTSLLASTTSLEPQEPNHQYHAGETFDTATLSALYSDFPLRYSSTFTSFHTSAVAFSPSSNAQTSHGTLPEFESVGTNYLPSTSVVNTDYNESVPWWWPRPQVSIQKASPAADQGDESVENYTLTNYAAGGDGVLSVTPPWAAASSRTRSPSTPSTQGTGEPAGVTVEDVTPQTPFGIPVVTGSTTGHMQKLHSLIMSAAQDILPQNTSDIDILNYLIDVVKSKPMGGNKPLHVEMSDSSPLAIMAEELVAAPTLTLQGTAQPILTLRETSPTAVTTPPGGHVSPPTQLQHAHTTTITTSVLLTSTIQVQTSLPPSTTVVTTSKSTWTHPRHPSLEDTSSVTYLHGDLGLWSSQDSNSDASSGGSEDPTTIVTPEYAYVSVLRATSSVFHPIHSTSYMAASGSGGMWSRYPQVISNIPQAVQYPVEGPGDSSHSSYPSGSNLAWSLQGTHTSTLSFNPKPSSAIHTAALGIFPQDAQAGLTPPIISLVHAQGLDGITQASFINSLQPLVSTSQVSSTSSNQSPGGTKTAATAIQSLGSTSSRPQWAGVTIVSGDISKTASVQGVVEGEETLAEVTGMSSGHGDNMAIAATSHNPSVSTVTIASNSIPTKLSVEWVKRQIQEHLASTTASPPSITPLYSSVPDWFTGVQKRTTTTTPRPSTTTSTREIEIKIPANFISNLLSQLKVLNSFPHSRTAPSNFLLSPMNPLHEVLQKLVSATDGNLKEAIELVSSLSDTWSPSTTLTPTSTSGENISPPSSYTELQTRGTLTPFPFITPEVGMGIQSNSSSLTTSTSTDKRPSLAIIEGKEEIVPLAFYSPEVTPLPFSSPHLTTWNPSGFVQTFESVSGWEGHDQGGLGSPETVSLETQPPHTHSSPASQLLQNGDPTPYANNKAQSSVNISVQEVIQKNQLSSLIQKLLKDYIAENVQYNASKHSVHNEHEEDNMSQSLKQSGNKPVDMNMVAEWAETIAAALLNKPNTSSLTPHQPRPQSLGAAVKEIINTILERIRTSVGVIPDPALLKQVIFQVIDNNALTKPNASAAASVYGPSVDPAPPLVSSPEDRYTYSSHIVDNFLPDNDFEGGNGIYSSITQPSVFYSHKVSTLSSVPSRPTGATVFLSPLAPVLVPSRWATSWVNESDAALWRTPNPIYLSHDAADMLAAAESQAEAFRPTNYVLAMLPLSPTATKAGTLGTATVMVMQAVVPDVHSSGGVTSVFSKEIQETGVKFSASSSDSKHRIQPTKTVSSDKVQHSTFYRPLQALDSTTEHIITQEGVIFPSSHSITPPVDIYSSTVTPEEQAIYYQSSVLNQKTSSSLSSFVDNNSLLLALKPPQIDIPHLLYSHYVFGSLLRPMMDPVASPDDVALWERETATELIASSLLQERVSVTPRPGESSLVFAAYSSVQEIASRTLNSPTFHLALQSAVASDQQQTSVTITPVYPPSTHSKGGDAYDSVLYSQDEVYDSLSDSDLEVYDSLSDSDLEEDYASVSYYNDEGEYGSSSHSLGKQEHDWVFPFQGEGDYEKVSNSNSEGENEEDKEPTSEGEEWWGTSQAPPTLITDAGSPPPLLSTTKDISDLASQVLLLQKLVLTMMNKTSGDDTTSLVPPRNATAQTFSPPEDFGTTVFPPSALTATISKIKPQFRPSSSGGSTLQSLLSNSAATPSPILSSGSVKKPLLELLNPVSSSNSFSPFLLKTGVSELSAGPEKVAASHVKSNPQPTTISEGSSLYAGFANEEVLSLVDETEGKENAFENHKLEPAFSRENLFNTTLFPTAVRVTQYEPSVVALSSSSTRVNPSIPVLSTTPRPPWLPSSLPSTSRPLPTYLASLSPPSSGTSPQFPGSVSFASRPSSAGYTAGTDSSQQGSAGVLMELPATSTVPASPSALDPSPADPVRETAQPATGVYRCGSVGSARVANFLNPSYPLADRGPGRCSFRLLVPDLDVCQVGGWHSSRLPGE